MSDREFPLHTIETLEKRIKELERLNIILVAVLEDFLRFPSISHGEVQFISQWWDKQRG